MIMNRYMILWFRAWNPIIVFMWTSLMKVPVFIVKDKICAIHWMSTAPHECYWLFHLCVLMLMCRLNAISWDNFREWNWMDRPSQKCFSFQNSMNCFFAYFDPDKIFFQIMKTPTFPGDLTDVSAKKRTTGPREKVSCLEWSRVCRIRLDH